MYCEDLLLKIKSGEDVQFNLQQFYYANYGLVLKFMKVFGVRKREEDDFSQLCFIACTIAVRAYEIGGKNSFISYYRRCVLHEFYVYKLEMRFPVKIGQKDYRMAEEICLDQYGDVNDVSFMQIDNSFCKVEHEMISEVLWSEVKSLLDYYSWYVIYENYYHSRPLRVISEDLGLSFKEIRRIHRMALRKLRRVRAIKDIAKYYYNIIDH